MLISSFHEVPEVLTGLIGLLFIVGALTSSILHNKRLERIIADENKGNNENA